jgi:RNA polymerase sigma-70 factor (ECF subfamily)
VRFEEVEPALLARCQAGDLDAFATLCGQIQQDLYAFVYAQLRDHDDSDEVVQECLFRIHRHLPKLENLGRFAWWVMHMAVNQCHSQRSRASVRPLYSFDDAVEVDEERMVAASTRPPSPSESIERREMARDIDEAIRALPPKQRAAIVMFEIEGRPVREIAGVLECSEGAVKFGLHEARAKLREALRQYLPVRKGGAAPPR